CDQTLRAQLLFATASNYVLACDFPRARKIYEGLAVIDDPLVRLSAAVGFEEATWRPGVVSSRAADLLSSALAGCGLGDDDPRYVRALASLGRALAFGGNTARAREVGALAIDLARRIDDEPTLAHALSTSLWHGTSPDVSELQLERAAEVARI